jgi:F-type H+-transporting ATPase subunit delta
MAELSTLARPYAEALFAAARDAGPQAGAQWLPSLEALARAASHPEVAPLLADPDVGDDKRVGLLIALAGAEVPAPVVSLLRLVLENGRLTALPAIAAQYRSLLNEAAGVCECLIESAFPMTDEDVASLVTSLASRFPLRLLPRLRVDPSLIGGVRVSVGDRVLDTSVRARLDAMRASLTA